MTGLLTTRERSTGSLTTATPPSQHNDQRECHDMKQVPWYAAMLCRLGIHSGKWVYVAEGNCRQLRVCGRCGKTGVRTKHQRQWQYIYSGLCEQAKVCPRCGASTGHRTRHEWGGAWDTGNWWNNKAHECTRCGVVEKWAEYEYSSYD